MESTWRSTGGYHMQQHTWPPLVQCDASLLESILDCCAMQSPIFKILDIWMTEKLSCLETAKYELILVLKMSIMTINLLWLHKFLKIVYSVLQKYSTVIFDML